MQAYNTCICLARLREMTKNFSQEISNFVEDLNPGNPEYQAGMLLKRLYYRERR
jgi:hypothetical protein